MKKELEYQNEKGHFFIYKYTTEPNELLNSVILSNDDAIILKNISSMKRKREWLAVRFLLSRLFPKETIQLLYTENGKPELSNGTKISISHSGDFVGIALSENHEIGLDIQYYKSTISRIQEKFIHPKEKEIIQQEDIPQQMDWLHYIWTAKEAIYKHISTPGTIFKEIDCSGYNFEKKKNWFATYRSEIFTLYSLKLDQLYISFCFNSKKSIQP